MNPPTGSNLRPTDQGPRPIKPNQQADSPLKRTIRRCLVLDALTRFLPALGVALVRMAVAFAIVVGVIRLHLSPSELSQIIKTFGR